MPMTIAELDQVRFDATTGLIPAIVQHNESGALLMLGYMDRAALLATLERRRVVFFSRSRQRQWEKGETSGHALELIDLTLDCDLDALRVLALPHGPVCHTGTATCWGDQPATPAERLAFLTQLEQVIEQRIADAPEGSYTARIFAEGPKRIAQKVGEEGLEVALAAVGEPDGKVVAEAADLVYHLLLLMKSRGLKFEQVIEELRSRHAAKP